MKVCRHILSYSLAASMTLLAATTSHAQETAKGWDRTVRTAEYLEPAIPHEAQQQAALQKLRDFQAKTGRKPKPDRRRTAR